MASPTELDSVYRERATLVALLARLWPSVCTAPDDQGFSVVYVETPAGQLSWHIAPADLDLFEQVARTGLPAGFIWDGHSTTEKYRRVARLCYDDVMSRETPSVGRIVHYVSYGTPGGEFESECRAAVVTEVLPTEPYEDQIASLCVLNPTGQFFNQNVTQDEDKPYSGGTWHWPEHVEA